MPKMSYADLVIGYDRAVGEVGEILQGWVALLGAVAVVGNDGTLHAVDRVLTMIRRQPLERAVGKYLHGPAVRVRHASSAVRGVQQLHTIRWVVGSGDGDVSEDGKPRQDR
jgi:hypothetical protein